MMEQAQLLYGRQLLDRQLQALAISAAGLQSRPAMTPLPNRQIRCERCGQVCSQSEVRLPNGNDYCPACIQLGRVTSEQRLYFLPEPNAFPVRKSVCSWTGQLTPTQTRVANLIKTVFQEQQTHLLWAVTGAGKTEMLFPGLTAALTAGKRVGIVSPRVDVCLELAPRLQAAFAPVPLALLHGQQTVPYRYTQLVLATTHQLLRFYQAFDVLVIDEVDAFPFVDSRELHFAVQQARKPKSACLYLTATPDAKLLRQIKQNKLAVSYVPRRFHGFKLPEPQCHHLRMTPNRLPAALKKRLAGKVAQQQRFLIFVPRIVYLRALQKQLHQEWPALTTETVYAADPDRHEKVAAFRAGRQQVLLATTILERGVTFPNIDVVVLFADDCVFTTSALVQMAGRAGRDRQHPDNQVDFYYHFYTTAIRNACRQIQMMNRRAAQETDQ
ncbi:DNA helicase [Lactobacillus selangorensis]|uniref:DNA helicase n=1 Tax=Lactobacillus selangorensis TaxID=81857 RepID=A0A0R2FUC8_9LACO|nr:helicase-related protein [Lactobacillus selangorensis]KRN28469.1 DNA helicase [Lactobacillus selangorensis]KRN31970.1 DNA helicase [Lactobacillus selangorensis]